MTRGLRSRRVRARLTRRFVLWTGGLLATALTTLATGALTGIPAQVFDLEAVKDSVRPGPDFRRTVEVVNLDDQGYSVAFPGRYRPTASQQRLMSRLDGVTAPRLAAQLRARGGVDVRALTLRIVLEGRSNQAVTILDMRPVAVARTVPVGGTLFSVPPQAGAPTMKMIVDLDKPLPVLRTVVLKHGWQPVGGRPFFEDITIRLRDRERDVLLVRAVADRYSVAFKLEVDYLVGAKRKTAVIDDRGRPFRVTGLRCSAAPGFAAYASAYELGGGPQGQLRLAAAADPARFPVRLNGVCGGNL
jgi:hypothetical protein